MNEAAGPPPTMTTSCGPGRWRFRVSGNTISAVRLAVGAVAARPLRLTAVEALVAGKPRTEETASAAGELAVDGATALRYNAYKIPLMRNLVKRAIRGHAAAATT